MRVGTWNLERGGRRGAASEAQGTLLANLRADVLILTEPHAASPVPSLPSISSPVRRAGNGDEEPWVAIAGQSVTPVDNDMIPYERLAVMPDHVVDVGHRWLAGERGV